MYKTSAERLKIVYITPTDARNKHSWSGTDYYIWITLQKNVGDITLMRPPEPSFLVFALKVVHGFSLFAFKKRFDWRHSTWLSKAYGRRLKKMLKGKHFDLLVAPASDTLIAHLETTIPIIYINDRTIAVALGYHKMLSSLWKFSERQSLETDQKAIDKSLFVSYPSHWAAQSAISQYGVKKEKVFFIPFGANIDEIPDRSVAQQRRKTQSCDLLFVGVNWKDKGGEIAFACLLELLKMRVDATLTIVGCIPPAGIRHEKLRVIPFLNKNIPADFEQLKSLWIRSTFLILPTRIDAFGIVFCEAAAYGLPSLGTDTGGVAGALHEGKNGFLMPFDADGKAYAEKIAFLFHNDAAYQEIVMKARDEFEHVLNWDSWAQSIKNALNERLKK